MNLFIFAKLEPHEIAELLLRKQKDMEFHMKNFVNIKGIYTNRIGILSGERKKIMNRYTMEIKQKTGVCSSELWKFIVVSGDTIEFVTSLILEAQKEFKFESPVELMHYVCDVYGWKWEDFEYDIEIEM